MKIILKLEELAMMFLALYLFSLLDFNWWIFAALFFSPDIGILGYLINPKFGAFTYNLLHHKAIAIMLYFIGIFLNMPVLMLAGLVIFAHSSFDRILGYGLKYPNNFKNTHLGTIGKA